VCLFTPRGVATEPDMIVQPLLSECACVRLLSVVVCQVRGRHNGAWVCVGGLNLRWPL